MQGSACLFHSFKGECIEREMFQTRAQARRAIFDSLEGFDHRTRRHSTLQYMRPVMYEHMMCYPPRSTPPLNRVKVSSEE